MKSNKLHSLDRRRILRIAGFSWLTLLLNGLPRLAQAAPGDKMKIGIIGSGRVGSGIGSAWVKAGHEVMFSSRNIEHDNALAARLGRGAKGGTPREAAAFGDVVMISIPYAALPTVGKDLAALIKGKVVIDTCNPFVWRDGDIATWARDLGAGRASAELLPDTRIVRAFNAIGAARMATAHENPGRVGMPIASDDTAAVEVASQLIRDVGYEPVLIGGLDMGKYLMPGTALAGERTAAEIRAIIADLG